MLHVFISITGKEGPDTKDTENATATDERSVSPTGTYILFRISVAILEYVKDKFVLVIWSLSPCIQPDTFFPVLTTSDGQTLSAEQSTVPRQSLEEQPLPPHPNNQRTEKGRVSFGNLILPAPHPMYRPYVILDEEEKFKRSKSRGGKGSSATF